MQSLKWYGDCEKKAIIALQVEKCGFRITFRLKPDFIPRRVKSAKSVADKSVHHHAPSHSGQLTYKANAVGLVNEGTTPPQKLVLRMVPEHTKSEIPATFVGAGQNLCVLCVLCGKIKKQCKSVLVRRRRTNPCLFCFEFCILVIRICLGFRV
jgi:hypothetical protein